VKKDQNFGSHRVSSRLGFKTESLKTLIKTKDRYLKVLDQDQGEDYILETKTRTLSLKTKT